MKERDHSVTRNENRHSWARKRKQRRRQRARENGDRKRTPKRPASNTNTIKSQIQTQSGLTKQQRSQNENIHQKADATGTREEYARERVGEREGSSATSQSPIIIHQLNIIGRRGRTGRRCRGAHPGLRPWTTLKTITPMGPKINNSY